MSLHTNNPGVLWALFANVLTRFVSGGIIIWRMGWLHFWTSCIPPSSPLPGRHSVQAERLTVYNLSLAVSTCLFSMPSASLVVRMAVFMMILRAFCFAVM
jgi:hypothetical protein